MKNLVFDTYELDKNATQSYAIPQELLMENAARGMCEFISASLPLHSRLLFLCGSGNNGADCLALARMLAGDFKITLILPLGTKSDLAKLQLRSCEILAQKGFLEIISGDCLSEDCSFEKFSGIVDGLFGAGFKGDFTPQIQALIQKANAQKALKIACDIPSGIDSLGNPRTLDDKPFAFRADFTLSMGALKIGLFSDLAKDFVGEVRLLNLGIPSSLFCPHSVFKLLESQDFKPPLRERQNTHKGTFGHLSVICGTKQGAGILAGLASVRIGAGLTTLITTSSLLNPPYELMQSPNIPSNTTAILIGMGYGRDNPLNFKLLDFNVPLLLDADIFYHTCFLELLKAQNCILTPHPKEFVEILKRTKIAQISLEELQQNRFTYALEFSKNYPNATLLLKGANPIIIQNGSLFINPLGSSILAKGGSGDVLAGLIGGLLAQGYSCLEACIQGSLAHTLSANQIAQTYANFSLSPLDLIEQIRYI